MSNREYFLRNVAFGWLAGLFISTSALSQGGFNLDGTADEGRQVGNIQDYEVNQLKKRRKSLNLWGFGFGPSWSRHLESKAMMYSASLTHHREVHEHGELRIRFGAGGAEDGSAYQGSATLGGAFFPFTGDITPLIGAEFGFGITSGKELNVRETSGYTGAGIVGVRFFRTSDTQMELTFRYESLVKENEKGRPAHWGAQISILY